MRFSPELILLIVISTILQMTVRSDPVLFEGRCAEDNGGCDQECISAAAAAGGYYCDCSIPGYQLLEDGITCQAVNFCEVLTPNPIDGVLNCRYTPSSNGWICFIVCDAGYFFVSGVNDYITCGIETDWKWSHQLVNDTAELPTCTREFFVDTKTVVRYDYILPEGGCSNHDLFDRYLHSTLQQGVEGMAACEGRCWAPSVVTSCQTDLPHTTLSVEVGVYFINGQQEAVGPDCGTRCRILNTRQILGETFRIITAVEDVVLSIGENVSSPTGPETPRVAPDSFIYEQPRLLCKEPGRVLTKKFFCVPCAPGSYLADPEDLHCTPCPVATYQLLEGQVSCSPCRPGSSTLTQGTVHPADCSVRLD